MKTEWMYFMAGAGLMAAVMSFNMNEKSSVDCEAVTNALKTYNQNERLEATKALTPHEKGIFYSFKSNVQAVSYLTDYVEAFRYCLAVDMPIKEGE